MTLRRLVVDHVVTDTVHAVMRRSGQSPALGRRRDDSKSQSRGLCRGTWNSSAAVHG